MDATINIQAKPTPIEYVGSGSVVTNNNLTDESGNTITDESGNALQPD